MRCSSRWWNRERLMSRTFTTATDDSLIALIKGATNRLAVIAPGLTTPVAKALATRMTDLPSLSLTVVLDADAEVYRMGYGDPEALEIIREASRNEMFDLREQPGVRIGVVIADDRTMVFCAGISQRRGRLSYRGEAERHHAGRWCDRKAGRSRRRC